MAKAKNLSHLDQADVDRIIAMAWEDRTPFEAIKAQFNLSEKAIIKLMRRNLKPSSFRLWRARVKGRNTKHQQKRPFKAGRFKSKNQKL